MLREIKERILIAWHTYKIKKALKELNGVLMEYSKEEKLTEDEVMEKGYN